MSPARRKKTTKTASKKSSPKVEQRLEVTYLPMSQLKHYPDNPRLGSVPDIEESIDENGFYDPLTVQKSTDYILTGNHTYDAASDLGYSEIACIVIDVDDERAKHIVLVSNRLADLGTYNHDLVKKLILSMDRPDVGTGYDTGSVERIREMADNRTSEGMEAILRPAPTMAAVGGMGSMTLGEVSQQEGDFVLPSENRGGKVVDRGELEEASDETTGVFELKDDYTFSSSNDWGIPDLIPEMLCTPDELPRPIDTWGGSASRDDPENGQKWWFYNYGIDSTSGMADISKVIIAFYCYDEYFENWWHYPSNYVTKALNAGIKYIVSPNFSMWNEDPKAIWMWSLFRSRWLGRYFQEAGLKLIPDINWTENDPKWNEFVLDTLPSKVPVISIQVQNFDLRKADRSQIKSEGDHITRIVRKTKCDEMILYSGEQQQPWIKSLKLPCDVLYLPNRLSKLSKSNRKKKEESPL